MNNPTNQNFPYVPQSPLVTAKAEGKVVTDEQMMGYLEALCKQIRKG